MRNQIDYILSCKFCGKSVHAKVISRHLKSHQINFYDYVVENLDDFLQFGWKKCVICGKVSVSRSKFHDQPTCSINCLTQLRKSWTGENSPRFGAILTEDTKKKIAIGNTGKTGLSGDLNPSKRIDVRKKISKVRTECGVAKGDKNPMYGKTHTPEAIQKIFSHRRMNKLEKIVASELDKNGIQYTFQFFIIENRICKSYDFKIKGRPIIIEVDGDFWHGNPNVKHHYEKVGEVKINDLMKDIIASERGYKVIRLWESDIKKDPSVILKALA